MVEAVWHGVFTVLGSSPNGGFILQQYAPNRPSSHRIFSDFLSSLNHRAIQFTNNERPEYIHIPFCFHSHWPDNFKGLADIQVCCIFRVKSANQLGLKWAGKFNYTLLLIFAATHPCMIGKKLLIYRSFWSNVGNGPECLHFAWMHSLVVSLWGSYGMLITSVTNQGDDLSAILPFDHD